MREQAEKDRNRKPFKSKIISFDGESQYVHLDYRLTEKIYSESKSDDDDEEKANAELKIEMFDISKITTNATIEAVRRFVHIELTRDWSNKRESINSHDSIKEIMKDSKTTVEDEEIIKGYDIEKGLYFRSKHSRLDNYQRKFLEERIRNERDDISRISVAFKVSKGVQYNLRNKRRYSSATNIDLSKDNTKLVDSERLEELIDESVKKSTIPIKVSDIKQQLQNQYDIRAPAHKISRILKRNLNYSYK